LPRLCGQAPALGDGRLLPAMLRSGARRCFNHYRVLGVERAATQAQVRAAYLQLVRECHPDAAGRNASAERFRKVQAAWEALKDPVARAALEVERASTASQQQPGFVHMAAARNTPEPWPTRREDQPTKEARARRQLAALAEGEHAAATSLRLNFELAATMDDVAMSAIARDLPEGLKRLALKFEGCPVTDAGVEAIARALSAPQHAASLQEVTLDLTSCRGVTSAGLVALAEAMPGGLLALSLDVSFCPAVGDAGMAALAHRLPESVVTLRLGLLETSVSPAWRALADDLHALRRWVAPPACDQPTAPSRRRPPRARRLASGARRSAERGEA